MSDKSSRFPSISSDNTTCYPKEVSITLTILSKPDEHPPIVSISPYPPVPVDRDVYRPNNDHPFIGLGDNLTSGTKYELWKGNQVLVQTEEQASQEEGEALILFVPTTKEGEIEARWQMLACREDWLRPYTPSETEKNKIAEIVTKNEGTRHPISLTQEGLPSWTTNESVLGATVLPSMTVLVPSIGQAPISHLGLKSYLLVLDGRDISVDRPEQVYKGDIVSYVEDQFHLENPQPIVITSGDDHSVLSTTSKSPGRPPSSFRFSTGLKSAWIKLNPKRG
ncbi:uncharacterized protein L199_006739 [Kwoniella botswanensis]|uniref:uncharacterized protein n=1 Tax=Kwoniella botswanensis TaxID=1268659 RepID=UPI00315DA3E3